MEQPQVLKPLDGIVLDSGSHHDPSEGMCVMEAVAYVVGLPHSDHPECASPIITEYAIALNDRMPHDQRQRLLPYIVRLAGSRNDALEAARIGLIIDRTVRVLLPDVFKILGVDAEFLRELPDLTILATATEIEDAETRALALARALDRARALARARDLDLARALDRARDLARDLDLARALARDLDRDLALARALDRARDLARANTIPGDAVLTAAVAWDGSLTLLDDLLKTQEALAQ